MLRTKHIYKIREKEGLPVKKVLRKYLSILKQTI